MPYLLVTDNCLQPKEEFKVKKSEAQAMRRARGVKGTGWVVVCLLALMVAPGITKAQTRALAYESEDGWILNINSAGGGASQIIVDRTGFELAVRDLGGGAVVADARSGVCRRVRRAEVRCERRAGLMLAVLRTGPGDTFDIDKQGCDGSHYLAVAEADLARGSDFVGSSFGDVVEARGRTTIDGCGGRDDLTARRGKVIGGSGSDEIDLDRGTAVGGAGADNLSIGPGRAVGGPGHDILVEGEGHSALFGGAGRDVLNLGFREIDFQGGSPGRDLLVGGPGNDQITSSYRTRCRRSPVSGPACVSYTFVPGAPDRVIGGGGVDRAKTSRNCQIRSVEKRLYFPLSASA